MEIFIPGLTALLLLALFLFLILPRLGTPLLAILSLVLLMYAVNNHMQLFYSEYRNNTIQQSIRPYAGFMVMGLIFALILGYVLYLFGIGAGNTLPASNVPAISNIINTVKTNVSNALGISNANANTNANSKGVLGDIANTVSNATSGVATGVSNAVSGVATGVSNVAKNVTTNVSNATGNLRNMLSAPSRNYRNNGNSGNNRNGRTFYN